jgi:hypothetical protein
MQLQGRALFNLLKINPVPSAEAWQVEDLRVLPLKTLFARLKELGFILDEKSFSLYVEEADSPEELTDCIWGEASPTPEYDKLYLLLFELWRRLAKEKLCLSIFCDELDQLIYLYDQGKLEDVAPLHLALHALEDILDGSCKIKSEAEEVFKEVTTYSAHDLEQFLVDYIADGISKGHEMSSSKLLDAFYPYVTHKLQFDVLRVALLAATDKSAACRMYERILEEAVDQHELNAILQRVEELDIFAFLEEENDI